MDRRGIWDSLSKPGRRSCAGDKPWVPGRLGGLAIARLVDQHAWTKCTWTWWLTTVCWIPHVVWWSNAVKTVDKPRKIVLCCRGSKVWDEDTIKIFMRVETQTNIIFLNLICCLVSQCLLSAFPYLAHPCAMRQLSTSHNRSTNRAVPNPCNFMQIQSQSIWHVLY